MSRELGHIAPRELWGLVNARRIRLGLGSHDLALLWGCSTGRVRRWSQGEAPCAAILLAAERWLEGSDADVDEAPGQCRFCGGFGQIAAHPDLIGSPKIPCGACDGTGRVAGGGR